MADGAVQVRQGALENSNVDHMTEMVQMVQVMRHFETMTHVVQSYDEMVGTAIAKLGSF
jgi:flagellar basal-body rod protein FlgF